MTRPKTGILVHKPGTASAEALARALDVLSRMGTDPKAVRIGGGAALAARWNHRRDDGVTLLCKGESIHDALGENTKRRLLGVLSEEEGGTLKAHCRWAAWRTKGVRVEAVSINPHEFERGRRLAEEVDAVHGIPIESPRMVLSLKLLSRVSALGEINDRDLHDMLELGRRDPESLRGAMKVTLTSGRPEIAKEILFLDRCAPRPEGEQGELMKRLRRRATEVFADPGEAAVRSLAEDGMEWLDSVKAAPRKPPEPVRSGTRPDPVPCLPPETFEHPAFREPAELQPQGFSPVMGKCMAGNPLNPTPEEWRDWVLGMPSGEIPPGARGYVGEHLSNLPGIAAMRLRQSCGVSLLDLAKAAHLCKPRGITFPPWLNRHALRSQGDLREQVESYSLPDGHGQFG